LKLPAYFVTIQPEGVKMDTLIDRFRKCRTIAVVGATDVTHKFGYKVYRKLKDDGFTVYAVNPHKTEIDGDVVYPSVDVVPSVPDALSLIVNAATGLEAVQKAFAMGVRIVWCQPGAESDELIDWCKQNDVACIYNRCVLVDI